MKTTKLQGKMMEIKEDRLLFAANRKELAGEGGGQSKITFTDSGGIELWSSQVIYLDTGKEITLQAATNYQGTVPIEKAQRILHNDGYLLYKSKGGEDPDGILQEKLERPMQPMFERVITPGGMKLGTIKISALRSLSLVCGNTIVLFQGDVIGLETDFYKHLGTKRDVLYEKLDSGHYESNELDEVQMMLDIIGSIPGVGEIADLVNAGISFIRGNWWDGLVSFSAAYVVGEFLKAEKAVGKAAKKFGKAADEIEQVVDATKRGIAKVKKAARIILRADNLNGLRYQFADAMNIWDNGFPDINTPRGKQKFLEAINMMKKRWKLWN